MSHSELRVLQRLFDIGLTDLDVYDCSLWLRDFARRTDCSCAVLVHKLGKHISKKVGTNGDEVWAVIRDNTITTIMFRRSSQPKTPEALRVDCVIEPEAYVWRQD